MATLVAWNMASTTVRAEEENMSQSFSFGMICIFPTLELSDIRREHGPYSIPQAGGGFEYMDVIVDMATAKIEDPINTEPYNYCGFGATASVKVSSTVGNGPKWATYWVDYGISCNPDNGVITGTVSNQPWTETVVSINVGTTVVQVHLKIEQPFVSDSVPGVVHSLDTQTRVTMYYSYFVNGADVVTATKFDDKLTNTFLAK